MNSSFSFSRFGVISRISSARWSVCRGGSNVGSWSLNGSSSRCCSISSLTSSPSSGTGNPGNGPVTELHDEYVSVSRYTSTASSSPVTITTPWCGSRRTGHSPAQEVEVGIGVGDEVGVLEEVDGVEVGHCGGPFLTSETAPGSANASNASRSASSTKPASIAWSAAAPNLPT